jgi:hypothetical protein
MPSERDNAAVRQFVPGAMNARPIRAPSKI